MSRRNIGRLSAIIAFGFAFLPWSAIAQQKSLKDQLIGTWLAVAVYGERPDGSRQDNFSAKPSGLLIFDRTGRFSLQIVNPDRPKHKSPDRFALTPEEYAAITQNGIAYSGTYSVDEAKHTFTIVIERSMFEQWQERTIAFEINGDELSYGSPPIEVNGVRVTNHLVWKRAN